MDGTAMRGSTGGLASASRDPISFARWALLAFAGGTVLFAMLQRHLLEPGQGGHVQRFLELNIGELFGTAAVASLLLAARRAQPALTRADIAILVACTIPWVLPEPRAAYAGMTLAAAWLLAWRSADRQLRDVAQVWLALSFCELWSKLAFRLVYGVIEPFEVGFIHAAGHLFLPGLRSDGFNLSVRPDWSVVILEGCSSFHNLSLAALIWLCVLKIAGQRTSLGAFGTLVISGALVIAVNAARILLMLPSYDAYHFWHDGHISSAVSLASVLASVVPVAIFVRTRTRRGCAGVESAGRFEKVRDVIANASRS